MTPSATTAAGRSAATPRPAPAPGRRRTARPQAPRGPRRVSGPARPRRVRAPATAGHRPSLAARGLLLIRGLPEHTLLDRIVRGRAWIPLLGVLLVGIVAMQVEILKLGAGMGRWIERSSTLSTRNQALQASVAGLMDDQRIERIAAKMGMVMPAPTAVSFLSAQPGGATRAAANIQAPDPSNFTAQSASQLAAAAAMSSTAGASSQPGATSSSTGSSSGVSATATTSPASGAGAGAVSTQPAAANAPSNTTTGGGAAGGAGGPVDNGASGTSGSSGQSAGSSGAASIAPPSSQPSAGNGG